MTLKLNDMGASPIEVACFIWNDAFTSLFKLPEGTVLCIADAKALPPRQVLERIPIQRFISAPRTLVHL
jgi:hypothetical protein